MSDWRKQAEELVGKMHNVDRDFAANRSKSDPLTFHLSVHISSGFAGEFSVSARGKVGDKSVEISSSKDEYILTIDKDIYRCNIDLRAGTQKVVGSDETFELFYTRPLQLEPRVLLQDGQKVGEFKSGSLPVKYLSTANGVMTLALEAGREWRDSFAGAGESIRVTLYANPTRRLAVVAGILSHRALKLIHESISTSSWAF